MNFLSDGKATDTGHRTGITPLYAGTISRDVTAIRPDDPPGVSVRQARRADLLAVYRIETASFPQPWPFAAFEQYLGDPGFLVAANDTVFGYIVADAVSNQMMPVGHIKNLAVKQNQRGRGLGSLLLSRGIEMLEANGIGTIKLEVRRSNEPALELYRSYGFAHRTTIEGYYHDGEDALLFVRES